MNQDHPRLIEAAFPIKQASLDSVHEKNVRHGHISTLHIWPARRPLAACRAALIATLLPDPGTPEERRKLVEKIGGTVVQSIQKKRMPNGRVEEVAKEETSGGVLHWGRESSPEMEWFRQEIRKAYGGRAPKVLDPFAGGGAIPLEAMRLGCEATAIDINPVAWFILKCTLEYPQKLAGQMRPLPQFALESPEFMAGYFKGTSKLTKKQLEQNLQAVQGSLFPAPDVDLAWHVRAWGWWVVQQAKADLEGFYPVVDGKPTVAYLWARTVTCKSCRATIPLLKTRWLCKKSNKRVLLTMEPNKDKTGVMFGVQDDVPRVGGNTAQRREHDKRIGAGTMSRSGATCPCCGTIMEMGDLRIEGQRGRIGTTMTAVVVEGSRGKEYRLPTDEEVEVAAAAEDLLPELFDQLPYGIPQEPTPTNSQYSGVANYGFSRWCDLFTPRQLLVLGTFARYMRSAREAMTDDGYPGEWIEATIASLACLVSKLADKNSTIVEWQPHRGCIGHTFTRFALPISWDFTEPNVLSRTTGNAWDTIIWITNIIRNALEMPSDVPPQVIVDDAQRYATTGEYDLVVTDPPYYDAIPYSDIMDFFYVWLRRVLWGLSPQMDAAFAAPLAPKWDHEADNGELIDDASRFGGDASASKTAYEDGMCRAFMVSNRALTADGRFVIVFAHKHPDAWEALVSAVIRAGFVVNASWPIQTEMTNRTRAQASAALSSSVWLVCRKRPETARPGWDTQVLDEMREIIKQRLRDFWDAGIRGPDFVWAATGPALQAYSKHPVVKKANQSGQLMPVSEFLRHVRRIVVDFVVGRVLSGNGDTEDVSSLDDVTTYYLLHRHDFGMGNAPVGACILYAVSCNLSDGALMDQYDLLARSGGSSSAGEDENGQGGDDVKTAKAPNKGTGNQVRLRTWSQRKQKSMGYGSAAEMAVRRSLPTTESLFPELDKPVQPTRMVPLIDRVHRLMHLWKEGDVVKVDEYLETSGMRHDRVFPHLLQALIELAERGSEERSVLESISNHAGQRGMRANRKQRAFDVEHSTSNGELED